MSFASDFAMQLIAAHQAGRAALERQEAQKQEEEDRKLRLKMLKHAMDKEKLDDQLQQYKLRREAGAAQFDALQGAPGPTQEMGGPLLSQVQGGQNVNPALATPQFVEGEHAPINVAGLPELGIPDLNLGAPQTAGQLQEMLAQKAAQDLRAKVAEREAILRAEQGIEGPEWDRRRRLEQGDAMARIAANRSPNEAMGDGRPKLTDVLKLQGDYQSQMKGLKTQEDAYLRVQAAANEPSAAGDLALIFGYMKILDPGSTVREGEFANAQNTAGVPDQVRNAYNRALRGERLNPDQRADFEGQARNIYEATVLPRMEEVNQFYTGFSQRYGVPTEDVGISQPRGKKAPALPIPPELKGVQPGKKVRGPDGKVYRVTSAGLVEIR